MIIREVTSYLNQSSDFTRKSIKLNSSPSPTLMLCYCALSSLSGTSHQQSPGQWLQSLEAFCSHSGIFKNPGLAPALDILVLLVSDLGNGIFKSSPDDSDVQSLDGWFKNLVCKVTGVLTVVSPLGTEFTFHLSESVSPWSSFSFQPS